jgi:Methyltransferase domain
MKSFSIVLRWIMRFFVAIALLHSSKQACSAALIVVSKASVATKNTMASRGRERNGQPPVGEPNFHKILERAGKTRLRPGGTAATEQLLEWSAGLTANDSVLELSGGLGHTGIMFAKKFGCQVLITDIDEGRLELAQAQISAAEPNIISKLVTTKQMDMFDITNSLKEMEGAASSTFDCAITEASLTHFPLEKKREFFQGLAKHVNQYLLHEICFVTNDVDIQKAVRHDMQHVLKLGFFPETQQTWTSLLYNAGFTNISANQVRVGPIAMLKNPIHLIRDEGIVGAAKIAKNIIMDPYVRSRIWSTRQMLNKHSPEHLGYIILRATKEDA